MDGSKLTSGTYQGKVIVLSPFAAGSPAVIPVTFQVTTGTISAPTTTLSFTQVRGGAAPAAQNVTVSGSPGALNFTVAASTTDGNAWLTVTPQTGTTPATLQVGLNAAVAGTLPAGPYSGTVTITSAGASGSPINIPVTLTVVSPQTFTASPTSLSFSYTVGLTAPQAQSFQISASGGAAPFSVTTPSSATLAAGLAHQRDHAGYSVGVGQHAGSRRRQLHRHDHHQFAVLSRRLRRRR